MFTDSGAAQGCPTVCGNGFYAESSLMALNEEAMERLMAGYEKPEDLLGEIDQIYLV